jgi:hypothetical protein
MIQPHFAHLPTSLSMSTSLIIGYDNVKQPEHDADDDYKPQAKANLVVFFGVGGHISSS